VIVINSGDTKPLLREEKAHFRSNQPTGSRN
jgi:hypothetical protein